MIKSPWRQKKPKLFIKTLAVLIMRTVTKSLRVQNTTCPTSSSRIICVVRKENFCTKSPRSFSKGRRSKSRTSSRSLLSSSSLKKGVPSLKWKWRLKNIIALEQFRKSEYSTRRLGVMPHLRKGTRKISSRTLLRYSFHG